jgi:hypothetical protein
MRQRPARAGLLTLAPITTLCLLVLASGCGHPATREECVVIFNKTSELKLRGQNISDPHLIELRTRELMDAKGEALINKCMGRTVTRSALDCVQRADSEAAVDKCLY